MLGQVADEETGLCWTRFRCFDPEVGRWVSPDPLGFAGGKDLFGFDGSPVRMVDPLGLASTGHPHGTTRFVHGVTVTPRSGPAMTGTVDLGPTLDRINSGGTFPHRNDGSVFGNREGLLPAKPAGYYREWVHPTPGVVSGPGPQRIITGSGGEAYYTPDHYGSFIQIR
jgi:RHS repeat-associated protein